MHQQHLADDPTLSPQSDILQAPENNSPSPRVSPLRYTGSQSIDSHDEAVPGVESHEDDHDDSTSLEPPPSYEQSLSSTMTSAFIMTGPISNPFLNHASASSQTTTLSSTQSQGPERTDDEYFIPRLAPRHSPSAPLLTLLTTTTGNSVPENANEHTDHERYESQSSYASSYSSSAAADTQHTRNKGKKSRNLDNSTQLGPQPAISPSYHHPSDTTSSSSAGSSLYENFYSRTASTGHIRTERRLQHKQEHAQHAASAPQLYPHLQQEQQQEQQQQEQQQGQQQQPMQMQQGHRRHQAILSPPIVPLSQAVIPAPPPRLLQFRSREPSSVPACPFLLCQNPIAMTKTRRERGVTVWIVCGLLFLCNTYWTTQSVLAHFAGPHSRHRVLSEEALTASSASRYSFWGEAAHLFKGFLGFKTSRYTDHSPGSNQRHQSVLKRPTVATVGVLQDEQTALRMILGFLFLAVMAIIRWWLCLTPLLIRSLFDTVHSCPHPHPYPYPEELEQERKQLEEAGDGTESSLQENTNENGMYAPSDFDTASLSRKDEKKRLKTRGTTDRTHSKAPHSEAGSQISQPSSTEESNDFSASEESSTVATSGQSRFRFFQRARTKSHQQQEKERQAQSAAVVQAQKKKLSWRARRALKKAKERRQRVIKASQDIGRYSLLYELGTWFMMDRWKQAVLAVDKIQPEAYED